MKVIFRVDSSISMGTGHLMRSITLAEALQIRGVEVQFISRDHEGNFVHLLQEKALPFIVLSSPILSSTSNGENYAEWLGVTQNQDAAETIEALRGQNADWLVVDHYGLDVEWETLIRLHVKQLMVIDDLANRSHDCDILLDQNYSFEGVKRYTGLLPDRCKLFVGPRYALLRPEYREYRKMPPYRNGQVSRIMVFFGGSDPDNMTGITLDALSHFDLMHIELDVVVGANNPHRAKIEQQSKKRKRTTVYGFRPHLADLMVQADLAIGAGGATTLERMCLGLPTAVITIADNQRPSTNALAAAKLIHYVGDVTNIDSGQLQKELFELVNTPERLSDLSLRNIIEVDGFGVPRLVETMFPSELHVLSLRPARSNDVVLYYNWVNDSEVRKSAINTSPISWLSHKEWFIKKLNDSNSWLFVLEAKGLPVGQIRFDRDGDHLKIDYSLDICVRSRGWGTQLVSLGADLMQQIENVKIFAEVREENNRSSAVFLRAGFVEEQNSSQDGYRYFYRYPAFSSTVNHG